MTHDEEVNDRINVPEMHEPILREHEEPADGFEPVPTWMMLMFGLILFWSGFYLARHTGDWSGENFDTMQPDSAPAKIGVVTPDTTEKLIVMGKEIYLANCVRCHQEDGKGSIGKPPLLASEWVVGPESSPTKLSRIVLFGLKGPIKVGGVEFNGECPSFGGQLQNAPIAAVLTYIRQEWGNKADPIRPDVVSEARKSNP